MKLIPVFSPKVSLRTALKVFFAVLQGDISGSSKQVIQFENAIANLSGRTFGVAVSNGSVALDLAFQSLGLQPNDEVILPSFTIISCLSSIMRTGAKPVFVDVDIDSWNMTLKDVEEALTENTKAILIVHTYGLTCDAVQIKKLAESRKIKLIEDASEAHGLSINGQPCGSFGDISTFSFYANKHITSGEGGMVLTNSFETYERIKSMRNLGFLPTSRFVHYDFYWNYRLSGVLASLGMGQIRELQKIIRLKKRQGAYYRKLLVKQVSFLQLPVAEHYGVSNHYWVFGIKLRESGIRDDLMKQMLKRGIETRPFFWPLHLQPAFLNMGAEKRYLPISEDLGRNGLYLPTGPHMTKRKQRKIISVLVEEISALIKESQKTYEHN